MNESVAAELRQIQGDLEKLTFESFTHTDAWNLGNLVRQNAIRLGFQIAIDIRLGETPLFISVLPGASGENIDWARRKRNLTLLTNKSSWEISRMLAGGEDLIGKMGLDSRNYAAHGGCIPIRVRNVAGIVATLTISGLPQQVDHEFAVECIREFLANN